MHLALTLRSAGVFTHASRPVSCAESLPWRAGDVQHAVRRFGRVLKFHSNATARHPRASVSGGAGSRRNRGTIPITVTTRHAHGARGGPGRIAGGRQETAEAHRRDAGTDGKDGTRNGKSARAVQDGRANVRAGCSESRARPRLPCQTPRKQAGRPLP